MTVFNLKCIISNKDNVNLKVRQKLKNYYFNFFKLFFTLQWS